MKSFLNNLHCFPEFHLNEGRTLTQVKLITRTLDIDVRGQYIIVSTTMKYIPIGQRIAVHSSDSTTAYEYETNSKLINVAVIDIAGRYPIDGWAVNTVATSLVYILAGRGQLVLITVK